MKHSMQTPMPNPPDSIRWTCIAGALLLTVNASSGGTISKVGEWPGYTRHTLRQVWSETTNAYLATVEGIQILDLSDSVHPKEHASLPCLEWWESPTDIWFQGDSNRLSLGVGVSYPTYQNRVKGIDLSNLNDPQLVWIGSLNHRPNQISQHGAKVYSSHQNSGMSVSTWGAVGDPSQPGSVTNAAGRVIVVGTRLYVPTISGFQIFSSGSYGLLGTFETGVEVKAMAVDGVYAYLAAVDGLHIVNVTNPAALSSEGFLPLAAGQYECTALELFPNHACLIFEQTNLLMVVNVESPAAPVAVGSYPFSGPTKGLSVSDERALVIAADTESGPPDLYVITLTNPANPTLEARLYAGGYARQMAFQGNTLFVADRNNGLCVLDLQTPALPQIISHLPGDGNCVAAADNVAYLGAAAGGFNVYDVNNPGTPVLVTNVPGFNPVQTMAVGGDFLYRIEGYPGSEELVVADIPGELAEVGRQYSWNMGITELEAFGIVGDQFALLVDRWQGTLVVIDVQADGLPVVTNYSSGAKIVDVAGQADESGTNVFLATTNGLEILDLSDVDNVTSIGQWNCPAGFMVTRVCVDGDRIALLGTNHLWVLDRNELDGGDPIVAETEFEDSCSDTLLAGNLCCGAVGAKGVVVLQIGSTPLQPTLFITDTLPNQVTLDWSAAGTGWLLQQNEHPEEPGSWTTVPGSTTVTTTNLPRDPPARFFRLTQ